MIFLILVINQKKYWKKSFTCSEKIGGKTEKMEFPETMPVDTGLLSEQIHDYTGKNRHKYSR